MLVEAIAAIDRDLQKRLWEKHAKYRRRILEAKQMRKKLEEENKKHAELKRSEDSYDIPEPAEKDEACSSDDEKEDDGECKEMPGLADMEDNSSLPVKGNHDSR